MSKTDEGRDERVSRRRLTNKLSFMFIQPIEFMPSGTSAWLDWKIANVKQGNILNVYLNPRGRSISYEVDGPQTGAKVEEHHQVLLIQPSGIHPGRNRRMTRLLGAAPRCELRRMNGDPPCMGDGNLHE